MVEISECSLFSQCGALTHLKAPLDAHEAMSIRLCALYLHVRKRLLSKYAYIVGRSLCDSPPKFHLTDAALPAAASSFPVGGYRLHSVWRDLQIQRASARGEIRSLSDIESLCCSTVLQHHYRIA
jgi:hypothetical protein